MTRKSTVFTSKDSAGDYEIEVFGRHNPKHIIVCAHGGGVRRWDGANFFYEDADHYVDDVVILVDQNQQNEDYITVNPLTIAVSRIQQLITEANRKHPGIPIIVIAHSYGCGVASQLDLKHVAAVVLVTPAAGKSFENYIKTYGQDVERGKKIITSDHLKKEFTAEFMKSIKGISWEQEYEKLSKGTTPVYVFEAGSDEIVGSDRTAHRTIPFTKYVILEGASHNLVGSYLEDFFRKLDPLLP